MPARNFHAVWPSLFATSMGLMAFLPVIALYVRERFAIEDPAALAGWASVIYGAAPFAAAIAGPFWGALGDRSGKKPMAIRANLAIALTTASMPLLPSPEWLLAMRVLQGVLAGYVAPAMALVLQQTPHDQHGRVIARLQVAMAAGSFLGPYVGAEVTHWFGRSSLFWVASALSALAALQLHLRAREVAPVATPARHPFLREFATSSLHLLRNPAIGWLLAALLVLRLGQNMLEPLLALLVRDLGPAAWIAAVSATPALALDRTIALAFAVLAVAQWVCTPWWGKMADRHGPLRCLALLALGLGGLFVAMAFVGTIDQFLAVRCAVACLMAGSMTLGYAAASKRVEERHRTLAFAMVQSCIQFGLAIGPVIGGVVVGANAGTAGFRAAFLIAAGLCAVAGVGMVLVRRLPAAGGATGTTVDEPVDGPVA
ncbi:MAG: MFS transporter [Planctomycetota bacterium]